MKSEMGGLKMSEENRNVMRAEIQLAVVKAKKSPLVKYMQKSIKKEIDISIVRKRLSKITKPMSKDISENRAERV